MPIDPRIALGIQPIQAPDSMNMLARAMQMKGMQGEQQLRDMQMQEAQRAAQETNALNELYRGAVGPDGVIDRNKLRTGLAAGGHGSRLPALETQFTAADKATADLKKVQMDTGERGYKLFQSTVGAHFNNPNLTRQGVLQTVQQLVDAGAMDPAAAARMAQTFPEDPQQLRGVLRQALSSQMTPEQMLIIFAPKPTEVSDGQVKGFRDTNPNSPTYGQTTAGGVTQMQMTPGEVAADRRAGAQLAETRRGHDMTDARARDLNGIARESAAEAKRVGAIDKGVTGLSNTLQKEGIPELETAVSGAEGALGRYKPGEVPGIGPVKNAMPAFAMSSEGKDVRQALAQVRNIVLSARSGAAVTDQELRRLVEEIGTGVGMSEDDIRKGLAKIRTRIDSIKTNAAAGVNDEVLKTYQERGGIPIKRGTVAAPAANIDTLLEKYK